MSNKLRQDISNLQTVRKWEAGLNRIFMIKSRQEQLVENKGNSE